MNSDKPGEGPLQESMRTLFFGSPDKPKGKCISCGSDKVSRQEFTDVVSWKEFQITCMCQVCQDEVYDAMEEEE